MQTVTLTVAIISVFFTPIFMRADFLIDLSMKKLYFGLSLYGLLTVLGGYATFCKSQVYIHLAEKKATIVDLEKIIAQPKLFEFKAVELISYRSLYRTDINSQERAIALCCALFSINNTISPIIHNKKPFMTIRNDIYISDCSDSAYFASAILLFNLFGVS